LTGRTAHNRTVNFAGDAALIGRIVRVRVTDGLANSLRGQLLDPGTPVREFQGRGMRGFSPHHAN
ncbi:MAG: TRAM domain-containing protein, partial [Magnetococcales bacterium]|nr:TRAM domain-containing protein [Magnetococcales bacterium]